MALTRRSTMTLAVLAALILLVAAGVACGGSEDDDASGDADAAAGETDDEASGTDGAGSGTDETSQPVERDESELVFPPGVDAPDAGNPDADDSDDPDDPDAGPGDSSADDTTASDTTVTDDSGIITVGQIPGDEPDIAASALRGNINNPLFSDPLVDTDLIFSGGVPPDAITPIDWPSFEKASTVDWLEQQEAVIALEIDGEARAYPVRILIWHEIVNDTFGTLPVTITYCPLCNSAIAFHRQSGDRTFTFGTSGLLYNSALVMYDRQTETLWAHYSGQAIAGELVSTQLKLIPVATVSWATFLAQYPDGLVLSMETGLARNYGANPYPGYDDPSSSPFLFFGATDPRLAPKTRVLAIRNGGATAVIETETLAAQGVRTLTVGSAADSETAAETTEVVAFFSTGTASPLDQAGIAWGRDVGATAVYFTHLDGQRLTFERTPDQQFKDTQTGSTWSLLGTAVAGPLAGSRLTPVEHLDTFWFAIAAYSPDAELIK